MCNFMWVDTIAGSKQHHGGICSTSSHSEPRSPHSLVGISTHTQPHAMPPSSWLSLQSSKGARGVPLNSRSGGADQRVHTWEPHLHTPRLQCLLSLFLLLTDVSELDCRQSRQRLAPFARDPEREHASFRSFCTPLPSLPANLGRTTM